MYNLEYEPFVGGNYWSTKFKTFILGESHHCGKGANCCFRKYSPEKCNSFTNDVIKIYFDYKKKGKGFERWMNTFTKFSNTFAGKKLSNSETVNIWESFVFYNYVQFPMQKPRQSPSFENFARSEKALQKLLKKLNPNLLIFWGYRLWSNFPKANIIEINVNGKVINCFKVGDTKYPILVVPHPSSTKLTHEYSDKIKSHIELISSFAAS